MGKTGIIGLGAMGQAMARNIMAAGIPLNGFDVSEAARARFAEAGGIAANSAAESARGCDLVVVMVATAEQARRALFRSGATEALNAGATIMLSSTISPADTRDFAIRLADMDLTLLDAPVSGGQVGAEAGTLTVMASGPESAFERAEPILAAIAAEVHRLGPEPGLGSTYKVVHQLAAGVHLVAAAELMALGVKAGCDARTLYEIVKGAAGSSWMFVDRTPRMMEADPPVTSTIDIFIKDVGLVLETGRENGMELPLAEAAYTRLVQAKDNGLGRADDSAVVHTYTDRTGRPVHD